MLHKNNYPAPRVHIICEDLKQLGGEFIIMDFMRGKMMYEAVPLNETPDMMAEAHVRLHKIDPSTIIEAFRNSSISEEWYDGTVYIDTWLSSNNMSWLKPGLKWVYDNEPSGRSSVIVHGDFNRFNILVEDGKVSAVLDWSMGRIGEPESDVASTRSVQKAWGPYSAPEVDWVSFTDDYLASYVRRSGLDLGKVAYYETVHCLKILEAIEAGFVNDVPEVRGRLIRQFQDVAGMLLSK
jgi:aminoglycoside phosphotransferase (APT) family kinase protein